MEAISTSERIRVRARILLAGQDICPRPGDSHGVKRRREILSWSSLLIGAGLGGCLSGWGTDTDDDATATTNGTAGTSSEQASQTTTEYSVDDLLVSNWTDDPRAVELEVSPTDGTVESFTDDFELEPKADDAEYTKVYPDVEQMSHEAQVTLDVSGFDPWEHAWEGDAESDHRGLHVYIEEDGLEVHGKVV
ncbi:hypothetical protein NGM10_08230 [Halorussus salilacus]|uniref:hypothetical protein n=1 Tax=Halorussus salilacus TaxID=2953750 RepID=UPI00209DD6C4|nr:hypothetical protein [Halorussus salilacus]USZ66728.1 hypothetical protein NGM10_08230 [Halorussus salilacus]